MPRAVTEYHTEDGCIFATLTEAKEHEILYKMQCSLPKVLPTASHLTTDEIGAFLDRNKNAILSYYANQRGEE